ncbi:uncharacterized protein MELLADRAFT_73519 [Melampsora larici-populina 98AG31]|uniref:Uncharacterized protein n=1 Tax=Melampsora larici-populina (strain 98AG31 / pathotype 3-4-7) TaxID=747676 RepID=F4S994_MELLP|nr:uncharacterized protein MELLADRAFT_73519 [Melampsora larici-populina 98AG31]EGF98780.1 hypothetical protein MELLADRAFT_73519 [Melampsora larici-populina 98AG31]
MPPASSAFQARQNGFRPYPSSNPNQPITNDGGMNDMGGLQEPYTGSKSFVSTFSFYLLKIFFFSFVYLSAGLFNNPGQDGGHRSNLNEPDPSGGLFEPPGDSIPSPSGNHVTLKPHIERVMDILNLEDHLREMVNEVISCTQPEDYFGVTIAMMGRLEQEFNKQAEIKADNADANWIAVDRFKVLCLISLYMN